MYLKKWDKISNTKVEHNQILAYGEFIKNKFLNKFSMIEIFLDTLKDNKCLSLCKIY